MYEVDDMDANILDLSEAINDAINGDEVWDLCFKGLQRYGVTSIFYGVIPIKQEIERTGLTQACFYKTNHPKKWMETLGEESILDYDVSTERMIDDSMKDIFVWHDESQKKYSSDVQLEAYEFEISIGMEVGVTLNLSEDLDVGVGVGVGLSMSNVSKREFWDIWKNDSTNIRQISHILNDYYRGKGPAQFVALSKKETVVLGWVLAGYTQIGIAEKMNISYATMEFHSRNIRRKLRSSSLAHACLKAKQLNAI